MTRYRCVAIPTEAADRTRVGRDDGGGPPIRRVADANGGYPCRHCLRHVAPGEAVLLARYDLPRPRGVYWTPSPIFLHAEPCDRYAAEDEIAPIVATHALISIRAYDREDLCLYDLGVVCAGTEAAPGLGRALGDPRTAFVNIHTAKPGCLLAMAERIA